MAAHGIPYAATASVGYLQDYMRKVQKASEIRGTKYIHVIAPCPTGWGIATDETVEIAKESVDCGLWLLAEYENGAFRLNHQPKTPQLLEDHIRRQGRFRHLTEEDVRLIRESRDQKWAYVAQYWNGGGSPL